MENKYENLSTEELNQEVIKKAKREKLSKYDIKILTDKADKKEKIIYLTDKMALVNLMALIYTD